MALPLANLTVAAALAGLIWTIQLVHYPLFALVGRGDWARYAAAHQRRITWIVLPLMVGNAGLAVALLADRGSVLATLNLALAAWVFAATGAVFAPLHGELSEGVTDERVARLVRLNWGRTIAWTAQVLVALALM